MKTNILSVQQCDALAVVQLQTTPANTFEFISVAKAMQQNLIEVTEASEYGIVNEIYVINKSRHFVFMMDGDILQGAKQNRVLNTSVLLAPETKTVLPVSCVEQGRWNYASKKFASTDYVAPSEMRKAKSQRVAYSMKMDNSFAADQSEVWDKVAEYQQSLGVSSGTKNFSDVFEQRESAYEKFLKNFQLNANANGIAFFINKKLKNADVFNRTDLFAEYFPKMLKGVALDVYGLKSTGEISEAEASFKTLDLFDKLEAVDTSKHKGVSSGEEKRFESNEFTGFELNYNSHLVHLSVHTLEEKMEAHKNSEMHL